MRITFNYIRNRIREHSKDELLRASYRVLNDKRKHMPIWYVFLLMKWTYIYGGERKPSKPLTNEKFSKLLNAITNFNQEHISSFFSDKDFSKVFLILHSQQFYLQTSVYKEKFATQLKLFDTINGKYNISASFKSKTGISISDFTYMLQATWLFTRVNEFNDIKLRYYGHLSKHFLDMMAILLNEEKVNAFLKLLVLDPENPEDKIKNYKLSIRNNDLQFMEQTLFTLYPFQVFDSQIKVIHNSVLNYTLNYYIYDFLKSNDDKFTTEFGQRFEKYIEFGIKEMKYKFYPEVEIKKLLPKNSNLVDFLFYEQNIYVECKAVEIQPYPSINPTDELLLNSIKDSILKAYFKQLLKVSKYISSDKENWGIILTYKKLFWSQFDDLYELGKEKFKNHPNITILPPENVFIIDLGTWDRIVHLVKNGQTTLLELLILAKKNNSLPETKKQAFEMHLDIFEDSSLDLSYLQTEIKNLEIKK